MESKNRENKDPNERIYLFIPDVEAWRGANLGTLINIRYAQGLTLFQKVPLAWHSVWTHRGRVLGLCLLEVTIGLGAS